MIPTETTHQSHSPTSIGKYADAAKLIIRELKEAGAAPHQIIDFLEGLYESFGVSFAPDPDFMLEGKPEKQTYSATQIARKIGAYSENGRPHAHAVSAILNHNLYIGQEHKQTAVLFETGDFIVFYTRYDEYALARVMDWVADHGLPDFVDGQFYTYTIRYKDTAA